MDYFDSLRTIIGLPVINPIALLTRLSQVTMGLRMILSGCFGSIGCFILVGMLMGTMLVALGLHFLWMRMGCMGVILVVEEVLDGEGDVGVSAVDGGDVQENMVVAVGKHRSLLPIITKQSLLHTASASSNSH